MNQARNRTADNTLLTHAASSLYIKMVAQGWPSSCNTGIKVNSAELASLTNRASTGHVIRPLLWVVLSRSLHVKALEFATFVFVYERNRLNLINPLSSNCFRACLHEGGELQTGEVTCGGSPHLSCKRDQIKMRDYMDRRVAPPKRVALPTFPHLHVNKPSKTWRCWSDPLVRFERERMQLVYEFILLNKIFW